MPLANRFLMALTGSPTTPSGGNEIRPEVEGAAFAIQQAVKTGNPTEADILRYREGVETLMRLKSSVVIPNGDPSHAAILLETFFSNAKKRVGIFCRNLNAAVFQNRELLEAARWALKRGVKIQVVVQEDAQAPDFKMLSGIELCRAHPNYRDTDFNFAVMDDSAVRMEPNRDSCEAVAVMHSPSQGAQLSSSFDRIFLMSRQIAQPITA